MEKMAFKFFLVLYMYLFVYCSTDGLQPLNDKIEHNRSRPKIYGGSKIDIENVPWQVALEIVNNNNKKFRCGGSIISASFILSAAHCVNFPKHGILPIPGKATILVGSSLVNQAHKMNVKKITPHPNFLPTILVFDFSLIELSKALTFSNTISPIALPNANYKIKDGTLCRTTGWGRTENGSPNELQGVETTIVNNEECTKQYPNHYKQTIMICAGFGGKGSCQGDSGGPLECLDEQTKKRVVIGVTSFIKKNCGAEASVYARVIGVREWIKSIAGI